MPQVRGPWRRPRFAALVSAPLLALLLESAGVAVGDAAPLAGWVDTPDGRREGELVFTPGAVLVEGEPVDWSLVLRLVVSGGRRTIPWPHEVRLRDGESWRGRVVSSDGRTLRLRTHLAADLEVPVDRILSVWLTPGTRTPFGSAGSAGSTTSGRLHRRPSARRAPGRGRTLPGRLVWIDEEKLAIASPLGVLRVDRSTVAGYEFPVPPDSPAPGPAAGTGVDELALVDGTRLAGRLRAEAAGPLLDHEILGGVRVPWAAVRALRRRPAGSRDLSSPHGAVCRQWPLTAGEVREIPVPRVRPPEGAVAPGFVVGVRLRPRSDVSWALDPGGPWRLRARLERESGARGPARVRWLVDDTLVADRSLSADEDPVALSVDLPAGDRLRVLVEHGEQIAFPAGVILGDPVLLPAPAPRPRRD